jgi:hypothetical protein
MTLRRILFGAVGALSIGVVSLAATLPTPITSATRAATEVETAFAQSVAHGLDGQAQLLKATDIGGEAGGITLAGASVTLKVGGLTLTRLTFEAEDQALAYMTRRLDARGTRVVEVHGNQVLVVEGTIGDARAAAKALQTGWAAPLGAPKGTSRALAVLNLDGVERSVMVINAPFSSLSIDVRKALAVSDDARLHVQTETTHCDMAANERAAVSVVAPRIDRLRVLRRYLVNLAALRGQGPLPS